MMSILRYIIPLLFLAFFWNSDNCTVSVQEQQITHKNAEFSTDLFFFFTDAENYVYTTSASINNGVRVQSGARRTDTGQRPGTVSIKAGRVINCTLCKRSSNISELKFYSLSEPYYRLISLGKLII